MYAFYTFLSFLYAIWTRWFPPDNGCSEIRAVCPIRAGEEITISYFQPIEQSRLIRQPLLINQFSFCCFCVGCADETPLYVESLLCPRCPRVAPDYNTITATTTTTTAIEFKPSTIFASKDAMFDSIELRPNSFICPTCNTCPANIVDLRKEVGH